jgi:hypothetical protein
MNTAFKWYAGAFAGAALLLGACADLSQQPLAPDVASFSVGTTSSHVPDDLFLIDNNCGNSTPGQPCATTPTGSDIYEVSLTGGQAVLTLVKGLHGTCAVNSSVDCNTHFNQAHIGVTPNGEQLWAINRNDVGGGGWPAGYVDLTQASRPFTYVGQIQGLGSNGIVMAAFSPEGDLMVANQLGNTIYRVNPSTLAVTGSWGVDINLDGADIAYNAAGELFIYTNDRAFSTTNGDERGLYRITLGALAGGVGTATAVRVGPRPEALFFTGLAFRAAGTGNLVMSNAVNDVIQEVNPATGAFGTTYPFYLNGTPYDHQFGDMASSLRQPAGATLLIIDEDGIDNGLHLNRTGGGITPSGPSFWTEREVNDDLADYGFRNVLRYFADSRNFGRTITVVTGRTNDEGWFAPNCIPRKWLNSSVNSSDNTCLEGADRATAVNNFFFSGKTPFTGAPSSWNIPQNRLDKIPHVLPLRARGLVSLEGKDVCALVYDSDISINYDHGTTLGVNGNLQGATYGIAAFRVNKVRTLNNFSSSTLPEVQITVLDAKETCGSFQLFNAPVPRTSSVPNDRVVENLAGTGSNGYLRLLQWPLKALFY